MSVTSAPGGGLYSLFKQHDILVKSEWMLRGRCGQGLLRKTHWNITGARDAYE